MAWNEEKQSQLHTEINATILCIIVQVHRFGARPVLFKPSNTYDHNFISFLFILARSLELVHARCIYASTVSEWRQQPYSIQCNKYLYLCAFDEVSSIICCCWWYFFFFLFLFHAPSEPKFRLCSIFLLSFLAFSFPCFLAIAMGRFPFCRIVYYCVCAFHSSVDDIWIVTYTIYTHGGNMPAPLHMCVCGCVCLAMRARKREWVYIFFDWWKWTAMCEKKKHITRSETWFCLFISIRWVEKPSATHIHM